MCIVLSSVLSQKVRPSVIVAMDYSDVNHALDFADQVSPSQCRLKVGKEMFTKSGPRLVNDLQQRGFDIFLDLKFHDIPNTVAKAISAVAELNVWMVNVHASGGGRMMVAAKEALLPFGSDAPTLIAVTVLTSMNDYDVREIGVHNSLSNYSLHLATLAKNCGLDGVVCSAWEAKQLKSSLGEDFLLVMAGIRPSGSARLDQQRIMTPFQAQLVGGDYIVVGRPITQATNPVAALNAILRELQPSVNKGD